MEDINKEKEIVNQIEAFDEAVENNITIEAVEELYVDAEDIPESYEFVEETIIGLMIQDSEAAATIIQAGVREDHFQKAATKLLYRIVKKIWLEVGACTVDMVANRAEHELVSYGTDISIYQYIGGQNTISVMLAAPPMVNVETAELYIPLLFQQYKLKESRDMGKRLSAMTRYNEKLLLDEMSRIHTILIDEQASKSGLVSIEDLLINADFRYNDRIINPDKYVSIPTGFSYIDKYGGIGKKRTTIIGGATSVGKSTFAMNCICNMILNDKVVLWFSPELDKEEIIDRMICSAAGINITRWKKSIISKAELEKYHKYKKEVVAKAATNLYVEDKGSQTTSWIIGSIRKHQLKQKVDVVLVDYIQKLKFYGDNIRKNISDTVGNFYAFGKENDIAMVLVSQLRRAKEATPVLADLKESGDIENFADVVILLHRSNILSIKDRATGYYQIAKNRQGCVTEPVELFFKEWELKFSEVNPTIDVEDEDAPFSDELYSEESNGYTEG